MAVNGKLPTTMLAAVPWNKSELVAIEVWSDLIALNAAFYSAFKHNLIINEGYRDLATQEKYYKKPPSGSGTAAKPGTSNHGWGLAVDLKLSANEYKWMLANAPRFGWVNPLWARDGKGVEEPWHWEHTGKNNEGNEMTPEEHNMLQTVYDRLMSLGGKNPQQPLIYGDNLEVIASRTEKTGEIYDRIRGTDPNGDMLQLIRQDIRQLSIAGGLDVNELSRIIKDLVVEVVSGLTAETTIKTNRL